MRRFEFTEGSSNKFWEITLNGSEFTVSWGKVGTNGQSQLKTFASDAKAQAEHDKLIKEKTGKGYVEVSASASTTTATPRVAAPVATPVAAPVTTPVAAPVAAPVATPVAAPVAAPVAVPAAAPVVQGDIRWDAEMMACVHPSRKYNARTVKIDVAKAEADLQKAWTQQTVDWSKQFSEKEGELTDELKAAKKRIPSIHTKVSTGTPIGSTEVEAVLAACFYNGQYHHEAISDLVDIWVARKGIVFAVEALLLNMDMMWGGDYDKPKSLTRTPGTSHYAVNFAAGYIAPWYRLREILSGIPEAEWQAALARASEIGLRSDTHLSAAAYLFPDADLLQGKTQNQCASAAIFSIKDPTLAKEVAIGHRWQMASFRNTSTSWRNNPSPYEVGYTLLAHLGAEAVPALCGWLDEKYTKEMVKAAAEVLGAIPSVEGMKDLFARLDDRYVVPGAQMAVRNFPAMALPLIAAVAAQRSRMAGAAQTLLAQCIRADDGTLAALAEHLPEASKKVVKATITKVGPVPEADPSELHRIFVTPPWTQKKKPGQIKIVEGVKQLDYPASVTWPEGQKERWDKDQYYNELPVSDKEGIVHALGQLQMPEGLYPMLLGPDAAAEALFEELKESKARWRYAGYLVQFPRHFTLRCWNELPVGMFYGDIEKVFAARYELDALPGLLSRISRNSDDIEIIQGFDHPDIAALVAETLSFRKKGKAAAEKWLRAHIDVSLIALIPVAVGRLGKARDAAENVLRLLVRWGHEAQVLAVAARYGATVVDAVQAVLESDPLDQVPSKIPKLPEFFTPAAFARPRLRASGNALPLASIEHLATMLAFSQIDAPYGGLYIIKELCTPESLSDFSWDLFSAWNFAGAPSKESWAFRAMGFLGDDNVARQLTPLIRAWPGESQHLRAVSGLDVLAAIGSDVALMHLNAISQKVKFKGLQDAAKEKIQAVAEARGLSPEELADRLVPDLGLDEQGSMTLDFGSRQFTVGFDESLKPFVRDSAGKVLPDLPKANKSDDADKAKEATETWKTLKKDVKALALQQLVRFEAAMCTRRRWDVEVFKLFIAGHPLVGHIVRRLVWGVYDADGNLQSSFRMAEDGSFADAEDNFFEIPEGMKVGLLHALETPPDVQKKFSQILSDYALIQPFPQLSRPSFALTEEEKKAVTLNRWGKSKVPTGKVLGLVNSGIWRRGPPQDAGWIWWFIRPIPVVGYEIHMAIEPGIGVGFVNEEPVQSIDGVSIVASNSYGSKGDLTFASLDPITASELLRELEALHS